MYEPFNDDPSILKKISTNQSLSALAVSIAEKFKPIISDPEFRQISLATAIQQGIDRTIAIHDGMRLTLEALTRTVEATGGLLREDDAPAGDPDWIDLGDCYKSACRCLGKAPQYQDS